MNRFRDTLLEARDAGLAIGSFTCYGFEAAEAVVEASEALGAPAILLVSSAAFNSPSGVRLARTLSAMAGSATSTILVQLDHETRLKPLRLARECGVSALMVDGSRESSSANAQAVARARQTLGDEIGIEGELGRVEGDEDLDDMTVASRLTDAGEVAEYVAVAKCDCLAVSIGNAHGRYRSEPVLDFERLASIAAASPVPLALHGASGLTDEQIRRAVANGVSKVNFNTDLRTAVFDTLAQRLPVRRQGLDVLGLSADTVAALSAVVRRKLELLGWAAG